MSDEQKDMDGNAAMNAIIDDLIPISLAHAVFDLCDAWSRHESREVLHERLAKCMGFADDVLKSAANPAPASVPDDVARDALLDFILEGCETVDRMRAWGDLIPPGIADWEQRARVLLAAQQTKKEV